MGDKTDVWQGTLALMVLKTLESMGPLHGYGIARRIEQTSGDLLELNYGTLYPALLRLEQQGWVEPSWHPSESGPRRKYYAVTESGQATLNAQTTEWHRFRDGIDQLVAAGAPR